jgi:hypothetical protein
MLLVRYRKASAPPIRHLLAWPAVLLIAINLYLGLGFDSLQSTTAAIGPLLLLTLWFIIEEAVVVWYLGLTRGRLLIANLFFVTAATLFVFIGNPSGTSNAAMFASNLALLLFALVIAAYLAVFEACQITGRLARQEFRSGHDDVLIIDISNDSLTRSYYLASLSALGIAALLVPLFYTFTNSGLFFMVLFAVHVLVSLWWWTQQSATVGQLRARNWLVWKATFAASLLCAIALDWRIRPVQSTTLLRDSAPNVLFTVTFVLLTLVVFPRLRESEKWQSRTYDLVGMSRVVSERMNVLRLLAGSSYLTMISLYIFQRTVLPPTSPAFFKADPGVAAYAVFVVVALIAEVIHSDRRRRLRQSKNNEANH